MCWITNSLLKFFSVLSQYANFKVFDCRVFPYLCDYSLNKLSPRSKPCIFLGCSSIYKGFRCFDLVASRTYITRHAQFDEFNFPFTNDCANPSNSSNLDFSEFLEPQVTLPKNGQPRPIAPCVSSPNSILSNAQPRPINLDLL